MVTAVVSFALLTPLPLVCVARHFCLRVALLSPSLFIASVFPPVSCVAENALSLSLPLFFFSLDRDCLFLSVFFSSRSRFCEFFFFLFDRLLRIQPFSRVPFRLSRLFVALSSFPSLSPLPCSRRVPVSLCKKHTPFRLVSSHPSRPLLLVVAIDPLLSHPVPLSFLHPAADRPFCFRSRVFVHGLSLVAYAFAALPPRVLVWILCLRAAGL